MDAIVSKATPALQVLAVVISYLTRVFGRMGDLFSFATGITSFE